MCGHHQWGWAGLNVFLHQKVTMGHSGGCACHSWWKSRSATVLSPGAFPLLFAGRISGFGRARLKFAGAAF